MSQPKSDHDPLLEFAIEPGAAPIKLPQPSQPVEPVAAPALAATAAAPAPASDELDRLRARIEQLEKTVNQSTKERLARASKPATKVGARADYGRRITAFAAVILGVAAGMWFFLNSRDSEPLVAAPAVVRVESPPPPPAVVTPVPQPQIVQAAAITPVRETPAVREVKPRAPVRTEYVGTLSIDADPGGEVFIDRKPAGKTPMRAENLKAGSHLVWVERDGYRRFTRVVLVPADRVSRVFADLEPEPH